MVLDLFLSLTVEVDGPDVPQQSPSLHRVHGAAHPGAARTQVLEHVVKSVGHGVNSVDDKLDLPLLFVQRVPADTLLTCRDKEDCNTRTLCFKE